MAHCSCLAWLLMSVTSSSSHICTKDTRRTNGSSRAPVSSFGRLPHFSIPSIMTVRSLPRVAAPLPRCAQLQEPSAAGKFFFKLYPSALPQILTSWREASIASGARAQLHCMAEASRLGLPFPIQTPEEWVYKSSSSTKMLFRHHSARRGEPA
jgi:hypothetical protein